MSVVVSSATASFSSPARLTGKNLGLLRSHYSFFAGPGKTREAGMGTLAYSDGYLVGLDVKGNLCLVETRPDKFVKAGEFRKAIPNVKHPAWTAPVIANGKLYLRYLQSIVCYDIDEKSY